MRIVFRTETEVGTEPPQNRGGASRAFRIAAAAVVSLACIGLLGSFMGDGGIMIILQQGRTKSDLRQRILIEETRQARLLQRVEALRSEPYELERAAREELGLVRERELVFDFRPRGGH